MRPGVSSAGSTGAGGAGTLRAGGSGGLLSAMGGGGGTVRLTCTGFLPHPASTAHASAAIRRREFICLIC